jgi:hypothetical protein
MPFTLERASSFFILRAAKEISRQAAKIFILNIQRDR